MSFSKIWKGNVSYNLGKDMSKFSKTEKRLWFRTLLQHFTTILKCFTSFYNMLHLLQHIYNNLTSFYSILHLLIQRFTTFFTPYLQQYYNYLHLSTAYYNSATFYLSLLFGQYKFIWILRQGKNEGVINNGQSRDTCNIGHTRHRTKTSNTWIKTQHSTVN